MFPYNQIAQLDKLVTIIDSDILSKQGYVEGGGIILIDVKDPPQKRFIDASRDIKGIKRSYPDSFYQDTNDNKKEFPSALKEEFQYMSSITCNNNYANYIVILIFVILLMFCLKKFYSFK
jgi:hypothetical protein